MKSSRNVLLISYYFAPNKVVGAKRISNLSYYLTALGHNVSVLTVKEKYNPEKDEAQSYAGDINRVRMIPPFPVQGDTLFHKIFKRLWLFFSFIDPYSGWLFPAILRGKQIIKRNFIDHILVSAPPFSSFFIGYILSGITNTKLIIDYRDPWFLYNLKNTFQNKLNRRLEELILKKADKIIFNTESSRDEYLKWKKIKNFKDKSTVIKNALVNRNEIEPFTLEKDKKVILYAGNFYGKRSLKYLIKPLQKIFNEGLMDPENIAVHVFGNVPEDDKEFLSANNLMQILKEHEKVNSDDILKYMKGADILYLPQGGNVRYSIAYKFYDYLSVKRPILAVTDKDSATAEIMKETDCGEIADIDNPEEIYLALKSILIENKKFSFRNSENYTWEKISLKFSSILEN